MRPRVGESAEKGGAGRNILIAGGTVFVSTWFKSSTGIGSGNNGEGGTITIAGRHIESHGWRGIGYERRKQYGDVSLIPSPDVQVQGAKWSRCREAVLDEEDIVLQRE